jgi:CxxC motif-containing protein (DUF1111 family)
MRTFARLLPRRLPLAALAAVACAGLLVGCSGGEPGDPDAGGGSSGGTTGSTDPRVDKPFADAGSDQRLGFAQGDAEFDTAFYPADGLGPLYANVACGACHQEGLRGPGAGQRMSMVDVDGVTPLADQSALPWGHVVRPLTTAGARTAVLPPDLPNVKVTTRVPPPILGRGYIEAILDSEIERVAEAQAQRDDGIHGQVNRLPYASAASANTAFNPYVAGQVVIGRFGLKARVATLDDFAADAFLNDMGVTSPMRPDEPQNPDGLTDDDHPGVDTTLEVLNEVAMYMRLTDIPVRAAPSAQGQALFESAKCSVCHVPSMKTRADYPIAQLAGVDAPVYTDLLVHDMGDDLADGMVDGAATSRQFRTAPLIAERFQRAYLHDGRAHTLDAAILAHGGEGAGAAAAYAALSADDKQALLAFVGGL